MSTGQYNSIKEVIDILQEQQVKYLILRNYENLLSDDIYLDGHGDVDCLCADSRHMAEVLGAKVYTNKPKQVCNDGTHFYILIGGQMVSLDLRHVGDGYYCGKWQEDMLIRRVKHGGFYVMAKEDYFYSLIYHAILQKPRLSEEYRQRLSDMAADLGFEKKIYTEKELIALLEVFMQKNGYTYTYPVDTFVPLRTIYISKQLITPNRQLAWEHWKFDTRVTLLHFLVCLKHLNFKL